MKAYYDQRRDDYYNGAGNTSPGIDYDIKHDGTTEYELTPLRGFVAQTYL
ncbi:MULTISPECIES: hypothetical protein [Acinetobacter]|nr:MULTISPECIES: hypothetical protein [Acinetobacter]ENX31197.1 hypothetical protein F890_01156 [Acinetobacter sp. CIP 64.7]